VRIVSHARNRGNGAARTTGVKAALGKYIVMTDADGTYPAHVIPEMLRMLDEGAHMVIGAREREAGTVAWLRRPAKAFIKALASYMVEMDIPDLNSGLRAMRKDLVERYYGILPTSHSWVSTITMASISSGFLVQWVPIEYHQRIGRSTFHPIRDTYNYLTLVIRTIMYFNPLRLFLPLSVALFLVGLLKIIVDLIRFDFTLHMPPSTVIILLGAIQVVALGLLSDLIVKVGRLRN
jgi:polyisoprenyl-phosphate glycosyltransferase